MTLHGWFFRHIVPLPSDLRKRERERESLLFRKKESVWKRDKERERKIINDVWETKIKETN